MTIAPERTLRGELRGFLEGVFETEDETTNEKLIRMAHAHFNGDPWMRDALIREGLKILIPEFASMVRNEHRETARITGTGETTMERLSRVFEHVGEGFSKSLLTMQRPDHLYAANEREIRAAGELRWAGFHRSVAALHKNDDTFTGDLSPKALDRVWREHFAKLPR